jgi:hypothetical protein
MRKSTLGIRMGGGDKGVETGNGRTRTKGKSARAVNRGSGC